MMDLYFGCSNDILGHFVSWADEKPNDELIYRLQYIDGRLAPNNTKGYQARFWHLTDVGLYAVSFWDYTVDKRPGSNFTFLTDQKMKLVDMLPYFAKIFPKEYARFPEIELLQDEFSVSTIEEVQGRNK